MREGHSHASAKSAAPKLMFRGHSVTWSARPSTDCGIVRPSAFAVFMLMTRSNFVGCSTGKSPGFAPLRILSTYSAARRRRGDPVRVVGEERTLFDERGVLEHRGQVIDREELKDFLPMLRGDEVRVDEH